MVAYVFIKLSWYNLLHILAQSTIFIYEECLIDILTPSTSRCSLIYWIGETLFIFCLNDSVYTPCQYDAFSRYFDMQLTYVRHDEFYNMIRKLIIFNSFNLMCGNLDIFILSRFSFLSKWNKTSKLWVIFATCIGTF